VKVEGFILRGNYVDSVYCSYMVESGFKVSVVRLLAYLVLVACFEARAVIPNNHIGAVARLYIVHPTPSTRSECSYIVCLSPCTF
jgi:hypothetical protein